MAERTTTLPQFIALAAALQPTAGNAADMHQAESAFMQALDALVTELSSAEPAVLRQCLEQVREAPVRQPVNRQWLRYYHGLALGLCEEYDVALAAFDALLATPALDPQVQARTLNSRAVFCRITGRLEEAMAGYRASLAYWRRLHDRRNEGKVLTNLGILAYQLQEYANAEEALRAAATTFAETNEPARQAAVQNELGLVYRDQGRWAEALACFATFAAHCQADSHQDLLGRALNNQGEVLLLQGKVGEATAAFQAALEQMSTRLYRVDLYLNLGLAALAAGDGDAARQAFTQARDLANTIGRRDILAQVHYRLGDLWQQQGNYAAAYSELLAAVHVIEATREPLQDEGLKISLLGRWQQIYEALVLLLLAMGRTDAALVWAERARARAFAEAGGRDNLAALPIDTPLVAAIQAALAVDQIVLCYFTTGVLDRSEPFLRMLTKEHPLHPHLLTPAHTLLFVLSRESLVLHHCPIDPNAFTSQVRRQEDRSRFFEERVLTGLRQMLLSPTDLASRLPAYRRCYLIPHGPLHNVPFGALGLPEAIHTPSLTLLWHHLKRQPPATPVTVTSGRAALLAVGYNGAQQALRQAESEARLVAALTGGVAWTGTAAKLAGLAEQAAQARILHLACHGWFDYEAPLNSYLAIGAGERLTAHRVLAEWRLNADLVVLSACQTGVNRVLRGDEPMGLIRGFLAAGARLVLATSWPVADLPTFLLMARFYTALAGTRPGDPAAALLHAQQWLRQLTRAEATAQLAALTMQLAEVSAPGIEQALPAGEQPFAQPRDWAGFVLYAG